MKNTLLIELMKRTEAGYEKARQQMREFFLSKLNEEMKETMFSRADKGFDNASFSIDFPYSCVSDIEARDIFHNVLIEEGFGPDDIEFTGKWVRGFSVYISWKEIDQ